MSNKYVLTDGLRVEVFYSPDGAVDIYDNAIDVINGDLPSCGDRIEPVICLDQYGNYVELKEVPNHECFSADLKEFSAVGEIALAMKDLECTVRREPNHHNIAEVERLSSLIDMAITHNDTIGDLEKKYVSNDKEELLGTVSEKTGYLLQGKNLEESPFIARLTNWDVGQGKVNKKETSNPSPS